MRITYRLRGAEHRPVEYCTISWSEGDQRICFNEYAKTDFILRGGYLTKAEMRKIPEDLMRQMREQPHLETRWAVPGTQALRVTSIAKRAR